MSHNGGRSQVNFWFLQTGGDYPFLNHLKTAQAWQFNDNSGAPEPSSLNANGYPVSISNGGVFTVFFIPSQANRPGNWKCRWTGEGEIRRNFTHILVSGSYSGVNGSFVVTPTGTLHTNGALRIDLGIISINVANPITNLEFFHVDDEARLDAGEVFGVKFKQRLAEANFGVLRFLDWVPANTSMVSNWAHRKPTTYVYYSGSEFNNSLYAGETANVGNDYTVAKSGFLLTDKASVIVKWNADGSSDTATLNVEGTGAKAIKNEMGDIIDGGWPLLGLFSFLVYDQDLDVWLKHGGSVGSGSAFLDNGVPPELMVQLCNEMGAHPWLHVPFLCLDPLTDYAQELATYCKNNLNSGLIPRFEPANEVWNSAGGFYATRYAWNKAGVHWGTAFDHHNWYGKVLSTMGEAISDVYADDRTRYEVVCGVQTGTGGSASGSNARLTSTEWVADGGSAAKDWATAVVCANYWNTSYTAQQEDDAAAEYTAAGSDAERLVIATAYLQSGATGTGTFALPQLKTLYEQWKAWGVTHGVTKLFGYEGGWSPDYVSGETDLNTLKEATKAIAGIRGHTITNYENFLDAGGTFPSCYILAGADVIWSVFDQDIYATPSPQWNAIVEFNALSDTHDGGGEQRKRIRYEYVEEETDNRDQEHREQRERLREQIRQAIEGPRESDPVIEQIVAPVKQEPEKLGLDDYQLIYSRLMARLDAIEEAEREEEDEILLLH